MLHFENISKTFGSKTAVENLNLRVSKGQVMGLLGPNGAGKSTSMKIAAGYLRPSGGKVTLNGIDVWKQPSAAKRNLGYLPERAPLYEDFTPAEYLKFIARLRKIAPSEINSAIDKVVDACHLESVRHQLISTLSKGYRHRVCLAQSLLGDPQILIFDEPTDGLDPNQKQVIRDLINRISPEKAIIVSTHILEEVEAVCTDVFIINHGKKVFAGNPQELLFQSENQTQLNIQFEGGDTEQILTQLRALSDVKDISHEADSSFVFLHADEPIALQTKREILEIFLHHGATILSFANEPGKIANSFRQLTFK